jgi:hypothetical protein
MSPLGYSVNDDGNVTITLTPDDWTGLLFGLGAASGTIRKVDGPEAFYRHIALVNRINEGNPNYMAYEIPEEFQR